MKPSRLFLLLVILSLAGLGGFYLADRSDESAMMVNASPGHEPATTDKPLASVLTTTAQVTPTSAAPSAKPFFHIDSWKPHRMDMRPLAPGEPIAARLINATAEVTRDSLPSLAHLKKGDRIAIPLRDGQHVQGVVNLVKPDNLGWVRIGGGLEDSARGSFVFSQRGDEFGGIVKLRAQDKAYLISTSDKGLVTVSEKPLSSMECQGMKRKPGSNGVAAAPAGSRSASPPPTTSLPVPDLDSLPSATAVLYLDFDGELIEDPYWNDGFVINAQPVVLGSSKISPAQITDVWKRVAEDFKPYNLSVTTIRSRYDNAPVGSRQRIIITSTDYWFPGAGGVAGLNTFTEAGGSYYESDVPCWAFAWSDYNTADISGTISHEFGHTFGLVHDSLFDSTGDTLVDEYYSGHGRWGPIMGTTYGRSVSQWSKCEFKNGSNYDDSGPNFKEDDLAIIGNATNGFGYQSDDADETLNNFVLPNTSLFNQAGIISSADDIDVYTFSTRGGSTTITVNPAAVEPNLDVRLDLKNSTGTVLQTAIPTPAMNGTITRTLAAGTYHISVRGSGDGDPLKTGYSTYGSIGAYTITGTFPAVPDSIPTISVHPVSQTISAGAKTVFSVVAASNLPLTYQWQLNSNDITGAKSATYTIASTQPPHQGIYRCVVTNSVGSKISDPATLSLNFKPVITTQPVKLTVGAGGPTPLALSLVAIGTPPLTYQWQKNNVNIPSSNNATFSIASPTFADAGTYRCIVTNTFGNVTSAAVVATVTSAPVITVPLASTKGVPLGGSATLAITAVGSPTLLYQWFKNNALIPGATKTSLTLSGITAATAATYRCDVKNTVNAIVNTTPSTDCVVTVGNAPKITTHPTATLSLGTAAALSLSVVASGDPTLAYQWQRDGINVGTDSATLNIPSVTWSDRGTYRCVITNTFGSIISKNAVVTVTSPPIIVSSPVSRKVARNAKTTLTVVATGSPTLKYQWRKDTTNITSGGTGASLVVTALATATYDCIVSNTFGTLAPTTAATVTVEDAPKISTLPSAPLAALGGAFSYTASVTGSPTLTFLWKKNNLPLSPTQTTNTLQLTNLQASDAATYTLVATNDVGVATSTAMKLGLQTAPTITLDPLPQSAFAFSNVTFTAAATGTATLRYQWTKNGGDILGATTNKLTLTSVQTANDGNYALRVTNSVGTATSLPALLTVTPTSPPTITSFTPNQGNVGHYIRLLGTNLNWTTGVTMQKLGSGVVNAPFVVVSPTELLVTVPSGTAALATINVVTRGGSATTSSGFLVRTSPTNDYFADARIIPGTGGKITGNMPSTFIAESGEDAHAFYGFGDPDYDAVFSAWHSFTPTTSGTYSVSTAGSAFDSRIAVYTGTSVSALTPIAANDDLDASNKVYTSYVRFEATAGTTYHIVVDGYDYFFDTTHYFEYGNYVLNVARMAFAAPRATTARTAQTSGRVAVPADNTFSLGGGSANEPAIVWSRDTSNGDLLTFRSTISFTAPVGTHDQCGVTAANALGIPQFGLSIAADTGALSAVDAASKLTATGQTLIPDNDYELELRVDNVNHVWGALLNGEWIFRDATWPSVGGDVTDIASQWLPGVGSTAHSTFTVTNSTISAAN